MTTDPIAALQAALSRPAQPSSDYDLNPDDKLPPNRKLRPAAVLIGVVHGAGGAGVLLTKRASHLRHHPGQISFPGGGQEPGDADLAATALREAREEIGLPAETVRLLGPLPAHETVTGFSVTPILAQITAPFTPTPDPGEVAEVFTAPLPHLLDPGQFRVERRIWRGTWRNYYVVPWGPYYIWGATARILRGLADRVPR